MKSDTLSPTGSFLALRMTLAWGTTFTGAGACGGGVAAATWSEGAELIEGGAGPNPAGSTLWTCDSPAPPPTHMKDRRS